MRQLRVEVAFLCVAPLPVAVDAWVSYRAMGEWLEGQTTKVYCTSVAPNDLAQTCQLVAVCLSLNTSLYSWSRRELNPHYPAPVGALPDRFTS